MSAGTESSVRLDESSAASFSSSRSPAAKKHGRPDQKSEIIPATGIGKGIHLVVRKETPDKAEEDEKAVQQPVKEARGAFSFRCNLGSTAGESEDQ